MNILHVAPYIESRFGGPPAAIAQLIGAAQQSGAHCALATTWGAADGAPSAAEAAIAAGGGKVHRFAGGWPHSWFFSRGFGAWLDAHIDRYDLLHLHVPFTYPMLAAAQRAFARGLPFAVMPHGVFSRWSLAQKAVKKRVYYRLIEARTLQRCAGINVTSDYEKQGVAALGYGAKTTLTPLCVTPPAAPLRAGGLSRPLKLLFLARLHPVKNLPVLFAALQALNRNGLRATLDIVGDGDAAYVAQVRGLLERLGLKGCVTLHGFLEGAGKAAAFANADVFVLPSLHENFGVAVAEAMAAALPVIVSDQVGIAMDIADAGAGLVVPASRADLLAQAMSALMDDAFRSECGRRARRLVERCYSREALARALALFYDAVVKTPQANRVA